MRVKMEIDDLNLKNKESSLDVIVGENMTVASLIKKMGLPEKYRALITVNGVQRSEYYSLDSGDKIVFHSKTGVITLEDENNNLKSGME